MSESERGSARLIRERMGSRQSVSEEDIGRLAGVFDLSDVVVERWWWRGQPAVDLVGGVLDVPQGLVGEVVGRLLETEVPLEIRVFPKGIPAFDAVRSASVQFRSSGLA